jgi:hypothetical protein
VDLNVQYAGNNRNNPLKILSNKQAEKKKYISLNVFFPLPGKMFSRQHRAQHQLLPAPGCSD